MKVNLKKVERLAGFALPDIDELVLRVNSQLGGVEEVINIGERYEGARIVRVVECEKHPNADRLSITKIDDGGVVKDVPRDENGLVQVVCGAPNVHANMWAVWLPPKSTVPASFDEAELFVLDARPLRGVLSQGMLAAADELAIGADHQEIVEIHNYDVPDDIELKPGDSFAEVFGLSGHILDIENKMFTHRPDCFGQLGVAREIAGIFGRQFINPDWYRQTQDFASGDSSLELIVKNEAPDKISRLMAVAIRDVEVKPSPLWLQCQLVAMGSKPINNVVDATNYVMLITAQPTHAYDYDKVRGHQLIARMARDGEKVALLNDKTYDLDADDVVIADGEGVIGLAGIMGGDDSEVSSETKNIILECATFDMYAVRKTAMRHGIFTDALTRFNKGQSPLQNAAVLKWLMSLIDGEQASRVFDERQIYEPISSQSINPPQNISVGFINNRLGLDLSAEAVGKLLENVDFKVDNELEALQINVPFWRTDINEPEDIVEEVGRLYGFDKLPRELPYRSTKPTPKNSRREVKQKIRESLSSAGANEVLSYSFVHENILKKAGQNVADAYKLSNALSPDLQYYRLSVLPSLLDKVHANIKSGHYEFMLFEIGKAHDRSMPLELGLPSEKTFVDGVYANKKPQVGAPYYQVRQVVDRLLKDLNVKYEIIAFSSDDYDSHQILAPFDIERSAWVVADGDEKLGVIGELSSVTRKNFKLPDYVAAFSLDFERLQKFVREQNSYQALSRFPSISQDISLRCDEKLHFNDLLNIVTENLRQYPDLHINATPLNIYQAEGSDKKTITLRIKFTSYEKTLRDSDVKPVIDGIAAVALEKLCAERL